LRDSLPIDMLLSAVSFLVVAQSSSEVPEGLLNNPVYMSVVLMGKYGFLVRSNVLHFQKVRCHMKRHHTALLSFGHPQTKLISFIFDYFCSK